MAPRGAPARTTPTVLRVITRLNIGGPARQALLLTRALMPTYRTILVAGTSPPAEGELLDRDTNVTRVPLVRPISPRQDLQAVYGIRRLIGEHHPLIVHTHMAKAGTIARVAARTVRRQPRTVHTFHGHVLDGYFSPRVERAFILAERALAKTTDVLVAISPEVRDSLLELGIGREEQYRLIPLGFDLTEHLAIRGHSGVLRERFGLEDDTPLIGLVGRLAPIKDPGLALRAIARLPDLHLAVVGDGELRAATEEAASGLGIADRVHFAGWVLDVPGVMADLDVVLLTSRNEGTPVALIEAAAAGVPAVATEVGGVPSVVLDGVTGILVPPGDDEGLADALQRLAEDALLRRTYGENARGRVDRWSDRRLIADVLALYDTLR